MDFEDLYLIHTQDRVVPRYIQIHKYKKYHCYNASSDNAEYGTQRDLKLERKIKMKSDLVVIAFKLP